MDKGTAETPQAPRLPVGLAHFEDRLAGAIQALGEIPMPDRIGWEMAAEVLCERMSLPFNRHLFRVVLRRAGWVDCRRVNVWRLADDAVLWALRRAKGRMADLPGILVLLGIDVVGKECAWDRALVEGAIRRLERAGTIWLRRGEWEVANAF